MTLNEKVAYIKGLAEGLNLEEKVTKEGKIIVALLELIDDLALTVTDLEEFCEELDEHVEQLDKDLAEVEETLYEDEDEEDFDDEDYYEVTCPSCKEVIYLDADMLEDDFINCPACGEKLEFDFDGDEDECDCGCGCNEKE